MEQKQNLFVMGCPRSGTTGLAHILNGHPDVVIGYESLMSVFLNNFDEFKDGLFESELYIDCLCHIGPMRNAPLEPEWAVIHPSRDKAAHLVARARVLGDKNPLYHRRLEDLAARFPRARFLAICRDLHGVARSFGKRFADPNDGWNLPFASAKDYHTEALRDIAAAAARGTQMIVVSYERLYAGDVDYLKKMLSALDLPYTEDVGRVHKTHCEIAARYAASKTDDEEIRAFAREHEDHGLYNEVTRLAL